MRHLFSIVLLVFAAFTDAVASRRPARVTGDQLIAELRGGPHVRRRFDPPFMRGYMAGAADAGHGVHWCLPETALITEVDEKILDALAARPAGSMPGAAAAELAGQYQAEFPFLHASCSTKPRLTGDQFVVWLMGNNRKPDAQRLNPSRDVVEWERYAAGYVSAVIDATQGRDWCAPHRMKPHELEERGWTDLVNRPKGSMPGNAAILLRQQFVAKYPCTRH